MHTYIHTQMIKTGLGNIKHAHLKSSRTQSTHSHTQSHTSAAVPPDSVIFPPLSLPPQFLPPPLYSFSISFYPSVYMHMIEVYTCTWSRSVYMHIIYMHIIYDCIQAQYTHHACHLWLYTSAVYTPCSRASRSQMRIIGGLSLILYSLSNAHHT